MRTPRTAAQTAKSEKERRERKRERRKRRRDISKLRKPERNLAEKAYKTIGNGTFGTDLPVFAPQRSAILKLWFPILIGNAIHTLGKHRGFITRTTEWIRKIQKKWVFYVSSFSQQFDWSYYAKMGPNLYDKAEGWIYALLLIPKSGKRLKTHSRGRRGCLVYVGQTMRTLYARWKEHIKNALESTLTNFVYQMMRATDAFTWVLVPLERVIPLEGRNGSKTMAPDKHGLSDTAFKRIANLLEMFWMNRLRARRVGDGSESGGLNSKTEQTGHSTRNYPSARPPPTPSHQNSTHNELEKRGELRHFKPTGVVRNLLSRRFISRHIPAAAQALENQLAKSRKRMGLKEMRELFKNQDRNRLEGILSWIYESTSRLEEHSNTAIALHWFFLDSQTSRQKSNDGRPILTIPYLGTVIEDAPFKRIIGNAAFEFLPTEIKRLVGVPLVVFKHEDPLRMTMIKSRKDAKSARTECLEKLRKMCTCQNDPSLHPYVLTSVFTEERHVITSDMKIMPNQECADLLDKGTGYRTGVFDPVGSQPQLLYEYLAEKIDDLCEKYQRATGIDARELQPFRAECTFGLLAICQAPQFLEPEESQTNERLSKHANAFLEWFRQRFVFIYVDKIASRFAIVCRWLYSTSVIQFLDSSKNTFEEVGTPDDVVRRLNAHVKAQKIVEYANKEEITGKNTLQEPETLKVFYLVPKLLKSPTKWRPISGSRFAPLTPLSVVMASILNMIQNSADTIWQNLVQSALGWNMERCQILSGCEELTEYLKWLNVKIKRGVLDITKIKFAVNDFKDMYTRLPQKAMIEKMKGLIQYCFELREGDLEKKDKDGNRTWKPYFLHVPKYNQYNGPKLSEWSTNPKPDDHRFIAVSRATAIGWVEYLILNVYVEAGGVAYHQIEGLPMGENYAVLVANLTCFCYETEFLQKMVTKFKKEKKRVRLLPQSHPLRKIGETEIEKIRDIIISISLSRRYIDDRFEFLYGTANIQSFIYDESGRTPNDTRNVSGGTIGYYPTDVVSNSGVIIECPLEIDPVCPPSMDVHCLDSRIWIEKNQIVHSLYDKRSEVAAFKNIATFPHRHTKLHIDIKRAVIGSQLLRIARRSTKMRDFIDKSAHLLARFIAHKYEVEFVWNATSRFLKSRSWPRRFGRRGPASRRLERELLILGVMV